jgi:hypothetical protein
MPRALVLAVALTLAAAPARAGDLTLQFSDGYVSLDARDVPVQLILREWSRLGNTKVVNADRIPGSLVTIQLNRVPEKQALEVLLRSAAGYVAAPRTTPGGASRFASILVMPPSSAPPPRQPPLRPPVMRPPLVQQPNYVPPVLLDDQDQPVPVDPNTGMPLPADGAEDGTAVEEGVNDGDPRTVPQASPYPGVQPFAPPGDPPPPGVDEQAPPAPQPVAPGPSPGQGTVVSPAPGQLPSPDPNPRQPRR